MNAPEAAATARGHLQKACFRLRLGESCLTAFGLTADRNYRLL